MFKEQGILDKRIRSDGSKQQNSWQDFVKDQKFVAQIRGGKRLKRTRFLAFIYALDR